MKSILRGGKKSVGGLHTLSIVGLLKAVNLYPFVPVWSMDKLVIPEIHSNMGIWFS